MQESCSDDSSLTTIVKGEVFAMVTERIKTSYDDVTLMVVLHLLAGEMRSCNEETLRAHKEGVVRIVSERGGMQALSNIRVAEATAA
jgi:hypothetical protein